MRIHPIQTGTVVIRERQRIGVPGRLRRLKMLTDDGWTEPLPILAWLIEHPEGLIVVDTGETARALEPGYFPRWHPYFRRCLRLQVAPRTRSGRSCAAWASARGTCAGSCSRTCIRITPAGSRTSRTA